MAVPVQTWGSLGSMVSEQKEFGIASADYLESNEVYDLFGDLLKQLIIHQPANPIRFLQDQLRTKPILNCCIIGPSGINRGRYCEQLAEEYGIRHINVGKLLRGRKELQEAIEAGDLVEDSVVIDIVKAELAKAKSTGCILDGYPRTKIQAQALCLKENGFCIDRVLLLTTGEAKIREHWLRKGIAGGYNEVELEDLIDRRLQQYKRHVISLCEYFQNTIRQIEITVGDDEQGVMYNLIKSNLPFRPYANSPLRQHRICIFGQCASGRSTQARMVAKQYGLVHVDVAMLLQQHQRRSGRTVEAVPPEYASDEELCALVGRRLSETDCLRKGFVLDGFPLTAAQAEFLRQSHMWPTRLIRLQATAEVIEKRMAQRSVDPITGNAFYRTPQKQEVANRLVKMPYDKGPELEKRLKLHEDNSGKVKQAFPLVCTTVHVGDDLPAVFQCLQQFIDAPLQHESGQDPNAKET